LALGGYSASIDLGYASILWVSLCYLMLVFGELCISPVGLALVTRVAPNHLKSTMMGVWWTISAYAGFFGALIAVHIMKNVHTVKHPASIYATGYFQLFIAAIIMVILLTILLPFLKRLRTPKS